MWYGISRTALSWFSSHLTDRYQRVKLANCFSSALPTSCGVPRGSVLGPLLVTLCTTPLSSVIQAHNLDHHLYADDTHIYLSLATTYINCSVNQLRVCLYLAVYLIIAIPFIIIFSQGHLETSTCAKLLGKGSYPVSSFLSLSTTS